MNLQLDRKGITRIVILIGRYAIKIPNFIYQHDHFLNGCKANWSERKYCKMFDGLDEFMELVAPSYFCSWFGLIQIQARCEPMTENLTHSEKLVYKSLCNDDNKKENFGMLNGKLVCLDYPD